MNAEYKNIVDVLDETMINDVKKYAMVQNRNLEKQNG